MFKFICVLFVILGCAAAKPGLIGTHFAYTAPAAVVAAPAPIVTATSSQVIARNYNGIASAPIVAPVFAKAAAPVTFAAPLSYSAPLTYAAAPVPALW